MDSLAWLSKRRFLLAVHREYDWVFTFDGSASIVATCLWRLLEHNRVRFTSEDEAQWFGLKSPVNAAAELNQRLANALVESVTLRENTLDLELHFSSGHVLQIIPDSSGYESWSASDGKTSYIATGGGDLAIVGS